MTKPVSPSLKYEAENFVVIGKASRRLKKKVCAIKASRPYRKRIKSVVPINSIKGINVKSDILPVEFAYVAIKIKTVTTAHVRLKIRRYITNAIEIINPTPTQPITTDETHATTL